jgi:hypothetical protein
LPSFRRLIIALAYLAWLIAAIAADLQAAEPRDDWTQAVVVVVDATASATSTGTFTVPGYADGMEYQGFIRISEPREVEQPDQ